MNRRIRYLFLSFIAITPASASVADTFLGVRYNSLIKKNEIVEFDTVTGQETLLQQFEFPSGGWNPSTAFVDPQTGLLILPDSDGSLIIYNRAENEISALPASTKGLQTAFPSPQPLVTDTDPNAGDAATLTSANTYSNAGDAATLTSANTYSNAVGAMMMAASQVSLTADPTANLSVGLGIGRMAGENAFAIGLVGNHQETSTRYSFTATYNDFTGTAAYGAGVSWSLR